MAFQMLIQWKNWSSPTVWKFYFQNISRIFPYHGKHFHTMEIGFSNIFPRYFHNISVLWNRSNFSSAFSIRFYNPDCWRWRILHTKSVIFKRRIRHSRSLSSEWISEERTGANCEVRVSYFLEVLWVGESFFTPIKFGLSWYNFLNLFITLSSRTVKEIRLKYIW